MKIQSDVKHDDDLNSINDALTRLTIKKEDERVVLVAKNPVHRNGRDEKNPFVPYRAERNVSSVLHKSGGVVRTCPVDREANTVAAQLPVLNGGWIAEFLTKIQQTESPRRRLNDLNRRNETIVELPPAELNITKADGAIAMRKLSTDTAYSSMNSTLSDAQPFRHYREIQPKPCSWTNRLRDKLNMLNKRTCFVENQQIEYETLYDLNDGRTVFHDLLRPATLESNRFLEALYALVERMRKEPVRLRILLEAQPKFVNVLREIRNPWVQLVESYIDEATTA